MSEVCLCGKPDCNVGPMVTPGALDKFNAWDYQDELRKLKGGKDDNQT